eukprot:m.44549 g.44549  ORF g.44549 m.44549 type:complete len:541 (+) comp10927_c0_seq2:42-1664(+)
MESLASSFSRLDSGDHVGAQQSALTALNEAPGNRTAQLHLAVALLQQRQYRRAVAALVPLENMPEALFFRAVAQYSLHQFDSAIENLEKYLPHCDNDAAGWDLLGTCFNHAGKGENAREAFEKAVAIEPTGEHLHHLAMLLVQEKKHAAAADVLERACASCSRPDERALLDLELGLAHMEAGHHATAVTALTRAVAALPEHAIVHHALGVCCSELGQLPAAIAHLSRALSLSPTNAVTLRALAWAYGASGDTEAAAIEYEHAAALEPTDAELLRLAGDARLRLGQPALAEAHYRNSLLLLPDQPELQRLLSQLSSPLRNRFALVLGPSSAGHALAGDAARVGGCLQAIGVPQQQMETLVAADATEEAIEQSCALLRSRLPADGVLLVYVAATAGLYSTNRAYVRLGTARLPVPKLLAAVAFAPARTCLLLDIVADPSTATPTDAAARDLQQALTHHVSVARVGAALVATCSAGKRTSPSAMCSAVLSQFEALAQPTEESATILTVARMLGSLEQSLRASGLEVALSSTHAAVLDCPLAFL